MSRPSMWAKMVEGKSDEEIISLIDSTNLAKETKQRYIKRWVKTPIRMTKTNKLFLGKSDEEIYEMVKGMDCPNGRKNDMLKTHTKGGYRIGYKWEEVFRGKTGTEIMGIIASLDISAPQKTHLRHQYVKDDISKEDYAKQTLEGTVTRLLSKCEGKSKEEVNSIMKWQTSKVKEMFYNKFNNPLDPST